MPMTKEEIERKRAEAMAAAGTPSVAASALAGRAAAGAATMPNQSRLTLARAAIRPEMKGRVMLSGPAGAGKTYTSLVVATALVGPAGRILVIDSEKESSLTYADVFQFEHLRWNPPFDPTALSLTLKEAAAEYDACIIDSFSHFWRKQGGVLDIAGDNVRGWKAARPIQENLIETILDVDMHMIVCCRSKMEHLIEDKGGGRITVTKAGIKAQQDDDLEYEVNVALEIDMPHVLHIVKSRTNAVPVGSQFLAGLAGDFAHQYRDWLRSGEPVAPKEALDTLKLGFDQIGDPADRNAAKAAFLDAFGRPEFLLVSRLAEAQQWVVDAVNGRLPVERAEDDVPPDPSEAPGAPDSASGPDGPPKAPEAETGAQEQPPIPSDANTPVDTPDPTAISHEANLEGPAAFNGDTGHCAACGSPIWYSVGDAAGNAGWIHAENDDERACLAGWPNTEPAGPGIDVDALYAATHPVEDPTATRARVEAEVEALSQTKLLKAIVDANLPPEGGPKQMRARLVEHLLAVASEA